MLRLISDDGWIRETQNVDHAAASKVMSVYTAGLYAIDPSGSPSATFYAIQNGVQYVITGRYNPQTRKTSLDWEQQSIPQRALEMLNGD